MMHCIIICRIRRGLEVEVVDEVPFLHPAHLEPEGQAGRLGLLVQRLPHDAVRLGSQ